MHDISELSPEAKRILGAVQRIDICVLVPKNDEFTSHLEVFGVGEPFSKLAMLKDDRYPFALVSMAGMNVALVCLQDQGNTASALATRELLSILRPSNMYLSGTALGNPKRTDLGSLRISDHIDHIEQWVEESGQNIPRFAHYQPPNGTRRDFGNFNSLYSDGQRFAQVITPILQTAYPDTFFDLLRDINTKPEISHMVTDNRLLRTDAASLWEHEERAACYDMECGGFARVLHNEPSVAWAVIRSVSDFGSDKSIADDGMRRVASLLAAAYIKSFLLEGLSRSHPRAMRPVQAAVSRLSPAQHYSQYSARDYFGSRLRDEFAFNLPMSSLDRELLLEDIATFLTGDGMTFDEALEFLEELRVEYFEEKYLDYTYDVDIRGYFEDYWYQEIREMLASYGYESLAEMSAIDVGCGNGRELDELMDICRPRTMYAVDLSARMLDRAEDSHPGLRTVISSANDLSDIEDGSIDVYFSFRTYMSRFFDVPGAIREAYRVLKPGGLILISIANGYLDNDDDGRPYIIPGLKEVNGSAFVSPDRPFELQQRYYRNLRRMGFERLTVMSKLTDVYVGALKPGISGISLLRLGEGL